MDRKSVLEELVPKIPQQLMPEAEK